MELLLTDKLIIQVSNNGNVLEFAATSLEKTHIDPNGYFSRDINLFLATLPADDQYKLYCSYRKCHELISPTKQAGTGLLKQLQTELKAELVKIYTIASYERAEYWVRLHSRIQYPMDLVDVISSQENKPDLTYLKSDYHHLVVLTVLLRLATPIWGEYLRIITPSAGKHYKETSCFALLKGNPLLSTPAIERLSVYMHAIVKTDVDNTSAIISMLSTSELPEWLLAKVLVRRLSVANIDASPTKGHLVSNIHGYVYKNILSDLKNRFDAIREKSGDSGGDREDAESILEHHKLKQAKTAGDKALLNIFVSHTPRMLGYYGALDHVTVADEMFNRLTATPFFAIEKHHLILGRMFAAAVMSPHGVGALTRANLIRLLCQAQATFHKWGLHELALLVTAQKADVDISAESASVKMRLTLEEVQKLNELLPYDFSNVKVNNSPIKTANIGVESIRLTLHAMSGNTWQVSVPSGYEETSKQFVDHLGHMEVSNSVCKQIAALISNIASIKQEMN